MPELPDLQIFSANLNKALAGKTVKEVTVLKSQKHVSEKELNKALKGKKLLSVYREGKELRFRFEDSQILGLHLMLNGKLYLFEEKNSHKSALVEIFFEDGAGLALTDFQGFANISLNPQESDVPDALSDDLNVNYLESKLKRSRTAIKNILMDQKIIRGIGNAYADEILWEAKLSPFSAANKIPAEQLTKLIESIKSSLTEAERQIKESHPDIINGEVRDFLKIHNHRHKTSPTGSSIKTDEINKRKTYFTEEQVEYK